MKVAVLGAGGTIAPAIVRDLGESEEVTEMRLLDLDLDRAETVANEHGGGKAEARQADATGDLADQLEGVEVLVNSASYRINLAAMRACLDAGCHYMDLGGLYHVTAEQLELSEEFEGAGLLALLGIGSAPGKTNLLAARALRDLEGSPASISVSLSPSCSFLRDSTQARIDSGASSTRCAPRARSPTPTSAGSTTPGK